MKPSSKDSEPGEFAIALKAAMQGNAFLSPKVARGARGSGSRCWRGSQPASCIGELTPREREVFQLLAVGHSNKEVARDLGMSLGTAKKHRENLQRKLDCHSPAELARLAIREGLLEG
ncbi:MAG: response regulator transcription factor [bacterium]|nr:response regulator transcription factor [Planctomycetota bacterium]HIL52994.1 response regulator transcription factor [Planctomycetota bacterium]